MGRERSRVVGSMRRWEFRIGKSLLSVSRVRLVASRETLLSVRKKNRNPRQKHVAVCPRYDVGVPLGNGVSFADPLTSWGLFRVGTVSTGSPLPVVVLLRRRGRRFNYPVDYG